MKATLSKGTTKILVLVMLFLSISILSYSALAVSYQKVHLGNNTLRIQTSLGEPILDIQLLENTDQCLVNCHAILKLTPHQSFSLPPQPSDADNIQFLQADPSTPGLRSHSFEILEETPYTVSTPIYQTTATTCTDNSSQSYPCTRTVQTGSTTETHVRQQWHAFTPWGFTFEPGTSYTIKITGQKIPRLGQNNIDWVLTLRGIPLREWAWWNSNWQYRKQITITINHPTDALFATYSVNVTFNHSELVQQGKSLASGSDIRIIYSDTSELDRVNVSHFSETNTTVFFRTQTPISSSSQEYTLYYGNPLASNPPQEKANAFNFSDDFEPYSLGDLNGQGGWSGPAGTVTVNDSQVYDGEKAALTTSAGTESLMVKDIAYFTQGVLNIKLWITGDNVGSDLVIRQSTTKNIHLEFNQDAGSPSSTDILWHINNDGDKLNLGDYPVEQWFDITVYFNTSKSNVTLNGEAIGTNLANNNNFASGTVATSIGIQKHDLGGQDHTDRTFRDFIWIRNLFQPEPNVTLGLEESINGSLYITDLIPIQVIRNVDLVKNKRTLVRTVLQYLNGTNSSQAFAQVKIFLQGQGLVVQNLSIPLKPGTNTVDLFFQPDIQGTNLSLNAEISSTVAGFVRTNISLSVNVTRTRSVRWSFVPVDTDNRTYFFDVFDEAFAFLNRTYPLADGAVTPLFERTFYTNVVEHTELGIPILLWHLRIGTYTSHHSERTIGIVPPGWFDPAFGFPEGNHGKARRNGDSAIADNYVQYAVAQELGHTYRLCDEDNATEWSASDAELACPNGDLDGDGLLDPICSADRLGCPTSSVEVFSGQSDDTPLFNFMGDSPETNSWVSNDTLVALLEEFTHFSPVNASRRIIVSGFYNRTSRNGTLENFYELGAGEADNSTDLTGGDLTVLFMHANGSAVLNISFNVSYVQVNRNGLPTYLNLTYFAFLLPLPENVSRFQLRNVSTILSEVVRSSSAPNVTVISPNGENVFSDDLINVSWTAADPDGDVLSFALLFSPDNGTTYSTVITELNHTSLLINSTNLVDCTACTFKVLATDGVNTGSDTSDAIFRIDNDLNVTLFTVVFVNGTERVFHVVLNNTKNETLRNLTASLSTGATVLDGRTMYSISYGELVSHFLYFNFSSTGVHTVTFVAANNAFREEESINVTV